jgi:hypothetical protein
MNRKTSVLIRKYSRVASVELNDVKKHYYSLTPKQRHEYKQKIRELL